MMPTRHKPQEAGSLSDTFGGDFFGGQPKAAKTKKTRAKREGGGASEENASIYFGPERLKRIRAALKDGQSLSSYVCGAVDERIEIPPDIRAKLEALATLSGGTLGDLIAGVLREYVRTAAPRRS